MQTDNALEFRAEFRWHVEDQGNQACCCVAAAQWQVRTIAPNECAHPYLPVCVLGAVRLLIAFDSSENASEQSHAQVAKRLVIRLTHINDGTRDAP